MKSLSIEKANQLIGAIPEMRNRKFHFITVATHCDLYFPALIVSANMLGYDLKILGWNEKWNHFRWKIFKVLQYIEKLPENDIVMVVDAFDVCLLQPPHIVVQRFLKYNVDFLAAGEQPTASLFDTFYRIMFKKRELPNYPDRRVGSPEKLNLCYLNAGTWIATVKSATAILNGMPANENNDQRYLTTIYLAQHGKKFEKDFQKLLPELSAEVLQYNLDVDFRGQLFMLARDFDGKSTAIVNHEVANDKYGSWFCDKRVNDDNYNEFEDNPFDKVLVDKDAMSTPCAVHLYCRGNYDKIMKKLGLPLAIPSTNGLLWYMYYSFMGIWHVKGYIALIVMTIIGVFSLVALLIFSAKTSFTYLMGEFGSNFNSYNLFDKSVHDSRLCDDFSLKSCHTLYPGIYRDVENSLNNNNIFHLGSKNYLEAYSEKDCRGIKFVVSETSEILVCIKSCEKINKNILTIPFIPLSLIIKNKENSEICYQENGKYQCLLKYSVKDNLFSKKLCKLENKEIVDFMK